MAVTNLETFDGTVADAYQKSCDQDAPCFVPSPLFCDDRGWSLMNQFQGVMQPTGQVNYSVIYPAVIKAWHRHEHQTDFWLCVGGHIKLGIYRESDGRMWQAVTGEKRTGVVVIPPTLWHGMATVGNEPANLLYYVSKAYDPASPDEERRAYDSVDGFSWGVEHK